jgi:hypothetical protein
MKKIFLLLSMVAIVGIAGYVIFKTLTNNDHGNTETNREEAGNEIEAQKSQSGEEEGARTATS